MHLTNHIKSAQWLLQRLFKGAAVANASVYTMARLNTINSGKNGIRVK